MKKTKQILFIALGTVIAISAVIKISDSISILSRMNDAKDNDPYSLVLENISKVAKLNSVVYLDEFVATCAKYKRKSPASGLISSAYGNIQQHGFFEGAKKTYQEFPNNTQDHEKIDDVDTLCFVSFDPEKEEIVKPSDLNEEWKEKERFCYIMNSTIRAGIDLSKITKDDLRTDNDTLYIAIPDPEIFSVIINPKDYKIYDGNPTWHDEQIIFTNVKERCKKNAIEEGLLDSAREMGEEQLTNLFLSLGFKKVVLKHKSDEGQLGLSLPNNG